jgi:hypothetical protein
VVVKCGGSVTDSFYTNIESKADITRLVDNIRNSDCSKSQILSFSIDNFDIDCDGILESVIADDRRILAMDEKGNIKHDIPFFFNRGLFLGMIPLPFDPENDRNYACTQKILDIFNVKFSINQNKKNLIKYLIKNSINGREGRIPSDWITDFDTTFQSYCGVFSPSQLSELGLDLTNWIREYFPLCEYHLDCCSCDTDNNGYDADSLFKNKGLVFCYYAHNHRSINNKKTITKIHISAKLTLYQTMHGILLRKDGLYRWIYHEDQMERLRWPSIEGVTVSEDGRITAMMRSEEEFDSDLDMIVPKPRIFQLKDFEVSTQPP